MAAIKSIRGLQNLVNLEDFRADWNHLTTVDFSGLTHLDYVDISDCDVVGSSDASLTSVNVTGCTALVDIRIDDSNFSAGFPDFSTCTSLEYFDADQSNIQGTLDLSNIPSLQGFDLFGNTGLTNLVLSHTQPLGDGRSLDCNGTALTQASVDGILHACASGSVSNGNFFCEDGTQGWPSEYGVEAIRVLSDRFWGITVQRYSQGLTLTPQSATGGGACSDLLANNVTDNAGYIHRDTEVEVGNTLYDDTTLLITKAPGWYGWSPENLTLELDENGVITQITACV